MKVKDTIFVIANNTLDEINKYGYVLEGVNGPYDCNDTPVRNSAHFIGVYKYLYKLTNDKKYYDAIITLADYICSYKSTSGSIECMTDDKMDHLNGSIGQAWAIEGLIYAYQVTNEEKYYDKALSIFKSQKYNFKKHLWTRIELNGKDIGYDKVFNHQLWFAASGFLINQQKENNEIFKEIDDFMKNVDSLFNIYNDGLFKHYIIGEEIIHKRWKQFIKKCISFLSFLNPKFDTLSFEKGYHLFDLYGFALIYNCNNSYKIFSSDKFKKAVDYALNIEKLNKDSNIKKFEKNKFIFKTNKYFYLYNSPAFEFSFIDYTFNNSNKKDIYQKLFDIQMRTTFNSNTNKFSNNNPDGNTLTARIYELTNYLEMDMVNNEK